MNSRVMKLRLLATLATVLSAVACVGNGRLQEGSLLTESRSVKLGQARKIRVELQMGAGELQLAGGAKDLLEAEFAYASSRWKPQMDYSVTGAQGLLTIRQPKGSSGPMGPGRNKWDLRLNDAVPVDLSVELGAGESKLTLGSLSLTSFDLNTGVGETLVDLTGDLKNSLEARIHGGVGQATVQLPRNVGVRVHAEGGIGQVRASQLKKEGDFYVNDMYGKSPVTLRVEVQTGVGEIHLEAADAPPVV